MTRKKAKPRGKPFEPGHKRVGGRKKGTPNKVTKEAREAASRIVDDPEYRENLLLRAKAGRLAPAVETMLWHYAKGKPVERVEIEDVTQLSDAELIDELRRVIGGS